MFIFKLVSNWVLKYHEKLSTHKLSRWDMKFLEDFLMGYENLKENLDGL